MPNDFIQRHSLITLGGKLEHTYIPKNACSTVKGTFLFNSGVEIPKLQNSRLDNAARELCRSNFEFNIKPMRSILVRHPIAKIFSMYIDKICTEPWRFKYLLNGREKLYYKFIRSSNQQNRFIRDRINFEKFARSLSWALEYDHHWRRQSDFYDMKDPQEIFYFEEIDVFWSYLVKHGCELIDTRNIKLHSISRLKPVDVKDGHLLSGTEIYEMSKKKCKPSFDCFISPSIRKNLLETYKLDFKLFYHEV